MAGLTLREGFSFYDDDDLEWYIMNSAAWDDVDRYRMLDHIRELEDRIDAAD